VRVAGFEDFAGEEVHEQAVVPRTVGTALVLAARIGGSYWRMIPTRRNPTFS
jgi:hypothetical protein